MHNFLSSNRAELLSRCKSKVAQRPQRAATEQQLANGIPLFIEQLIRTLEAEEDDKTADSIRISGPSGGDSLALSEMGVGSAAHGKALLELGYTMDQVVHDYGDLCQAIMDLAFERDAPFAIGVFRTLNRCLDNAIADAVMEFSFQRDTQIARQQSLDATEHDVALKAYESGEHVLIEVEDHCGGLPLGSAARIVRLSSWPRRSPMLPCVHRAD